MLYKSKNIVKAHNAVVKKSKNHGPKQPFLKEHDPGLEPGKPFNGC